LHSIPFHVGNDEELTAILMLGRCVSGGCFDKDSERERQLHNLLRGFDSLLGSGDDWHLLAAAEPSQETPRVTGR
jgi:hypothetical protein